MIKPSGLTSPQQKEFAFVRAMYPVAMNAVEVAWNSVMSPVPTTVEDLERMLDKKITYIKEVHDKAEVSERKYMIISGLSGVVAMISLIVESKLLRRSLPLVVLSFSCVLVGAIALAVADHYRSIKEKEPPHGIVKSHSKVLHLMTSLEMSEEQCVRIDAKMAYLKNNIPYGWQ